MVENQVGYRFAPTKEELVNYFLKNKNLENCWNVDDLIGEINISSFEPKDLPALSRIQSKDLVWYYFSPILYANARKTTMKRTTSTGFWKITGPDGTIKDKRGSRIGIKKTLVFHQGKGANGVRTPWVMHEYHITYLPREKRTYVLCQVKYKGDHRDISYGGNDSVVPHWDIGREINTVPEVQVNQLVEDVLTLNDLSSPLNVQDDLRSLDAINPNQMQLTPKVQVNPPPPVLEDDLPPPPPLLEGHLVRSLDYVEMPDIEQDDLPPPDAFDPNMLCNDDFLNLPPQTPYDDYYWNDYVTNNGWIYEDMITDEVMMREYATFTCQ